MIQERRRRTPEEIAAAKKEAAEKLKSKEQAIKAKKRKTAHDIRHAAELEDAVAKQRQEEEDAFPRRLSGTYLTPNVIFFTDVATRCRNRSRFGA